MAESGELLADFLRTRCNLNVYGLRYLNKEQTLIAIPWRNLGKAREEPLQNSTQIFQDWASISFRRRRAADVLDTNESLADQKHRFRNALGKAKGLLYRHDIKIPGVKVCQLLDSKSSLPTTASTNCCVEMSTFNNCLDFFETEEFLNHNSPTSSLFLEYSPAPNNVPCGQENVPSQQDNRFQFVNSPLPWEERQVDATYNNDIDEDIITDLFAGDMEMSEAVSTWSCPTATPNSIPECSPPSIVVEQEPNVNVFPKTDQAKLVIKLHFRDREASSWKITHEIGCRLYTGKNIPDISQLLEKEHLAVLMSKFKYSQEYLFGPESLQQVQIPNVNNFMNSTAPHAHKCKKIFKFMDRGLLLYLEYTNSLIPNVFAMRLCQTRIFLHNDRLNLQNGCTSPIDPLKRMEWTKVFDGEVFLKQCMAVDKGPSNTMPYPRASFCLSLGARPVVEDQSCLPVSVTITVGKAQQILDSKLDNERQDYISIVNSMDEEAKQLAKDLAEKTTLQDKVLDV